MSSSSGAGGAHSGGTTGAGGATGSGGSPATGGATRAGGSVGNGGSATGGRVGSGGSATGGDAMSGGGTAGGTGGNGGGSTGGRTGSGGGIGRDGGAADGTAGGSGGSAGASAGGAGSGGRVGGGGNSGQGGTAAGGADAGRGGTGGGTGGSAGNDGGPSAFEPCPASGACKIMPLGDSITEGTGFPGGYRGKLYSKAVADNKTITFVGSLTSNPPTGIAGFPTAHEGHFAWTIQQIDDIVPSPALGPSPHIVLLHIGTNDVNQKLSGAPARLKSLVSQIVTALPNSLLAVAKIIPVSGSTSAVEAYNAEIPAIVQEQAQGGKHVILVDQYTGFPTSELGDGVHPNQAGYTRMADVWYAAIRSYLH
jgi:lysophospholipase L1-like esterase